MNAKQEIAAQTRAQIYESLTAEYCQGIERLLDRMESVADQGAIPRSYVDALHNCLDVAGGTAWRA